MANNQPALPTYPGNYAVFHKGLKRFYCGRDENRKPIWGSKENAIREDRFGTSCTAAGLLRGDEKVQQKPVYIGASS